MTAAQIKHMVEQFLRWKLPSNFSPDNGITFSPTYKGFDGTDVQRDPVGTNLFDYTQTEAMVEHMLEGLPEDDA